jgi:hypothetical protein
MAGVILILGLIAAGLYSGAWGFYVAAVIGGGLYLLTMLIIAGVMSAAASQIKKSGNNINLRKRF